MLSCDGSRLAGVMLRCEAMSLGKLELAVMIAALRAADVFVSMHGGDVINALHMRPGRAVLELVNPGFQKAGGWLNQYSQLLTPVIRHERLVLPASSGGKGQGGKNQRSLHRAWNANATLAWPLLAEAIAGVMNRTERSVKLAADRQRDAALLAKGALKRLCC
uniref:Uncharacterized protein n=1 Tax=Calcidiscus leptoporus TaxID=127549 RepID=A0A7S0J3A0_9EUKA